MDDFENYHWMGDFENIPHICCQKIEIQIDGRIMCLMKFSPNSWANCVVSNSGTQLWTSNKSCLKRILDQF